jgi:hypothetical protein
MCEILPRVTNISVNSSRKAEALFAWARHLYWAETMRRSHDNVWERDATNQASRTSSAEWLGGVGYWGASLYVVIEGWETIGFKDPIVDALLNIPQCKDTLRRLRNGIFHYQPELLSPKLVGFTRQPQMVLWIHTLHEEFCRWLRDFIDKAAHSVGITQEQLKETIGDDLVSVIGWFPQRPAEESNDELKALVAEAVAMPDPTDFSPEAQSLRESPKLYDAAVKETAARVRHYRRDCLAQLGLNPDQFIP